MALDVHVFRCLADNYGFLIRDRATGTVAAIDAPEARAVEAAVADTGWDRLDLIVNTHWHADHTQGNAALKARFDCRITGPDEVSRVAPLDDAVTDGDTVRVGETRLEVTATPGHTLGHLVYRSVADRLAFVGDTLFTLGCGRMFEGTPEQMWESLCRIAAWPDETLIHGAHDYAQGNGRFALSLDNRPDAVAHIQAVMERSRAGLPVSPSPLWVEKTYNPFLRAGDTAGFARLRQAKDVFTG